MSLKLSTGFRNTMLRAGGKSAVDILADGYFEIREGQQSISADAVETGTLLARITLNSGTYTDLTTNGITPEAVGVILSKPVGEVWSGVGLANGVAGHWIWYDKNGTHGASTTAARLSGSIAQGGGQLRMSSTDVKVGVTLTIDSCAINFPTA